MSFHFTLTSWYFFLGTQCYAAAAVKSLPSCLTLCDRIDGSPPGSPIPGILQARTLEWVAISFSNAWKWKVKVNSLGRVRFHDPHNTFWFLQHLFTFTYPSYLLSDSTAFLSFSAIETLILLNITHKLLLLEEK